MLPEMQRISKYMWLMFYLLWKVFIFRFLFSPPTVV